MSPRLPRPTGAAVVAALGRAGFAVLRVRGSHHYLRHSDERSTVVPVHAGETIGPGLEAHDCSSHRVRMQSSTFRKFVDLALPQPRRMRAALREALRVELGVPRPPVVRDVLRRLEVDVHGAGFAYLPQELQRARAAGAVATARLHITSDRAVVIIFEDSRMEAGCTATRRVTFVFPRVD